MCDILKNMGFALLISIKTLFPMYQQQNIYPAWHATFDCHSEMGIFRWQMTQQANILQC